MERACKTGIVILVFLRKLPAASENEISAVFLQPGIHASGICGKIWNHNLFEKLLSGVKTQRSLARQRSHNKGIGTLTQLSCGLLGLVEQGLLALHVQYAVGTKTFQTRAGGKRFVYGVIHIRRTEQVLTCSLRLQTEFPEFLHPGQAHERVTDPQGMIQKREGTIFLHGRQPQGQLGHLHGHGVVVHAVKAAVRHKTPRHEQTLFRIGRKPVMGVPLPRFHQPFCEITARLHQKGARPHGHVANLKSENVLGFSQLPPVTRQALRRSLIDMRLQRGGNKTFRNGARRIMGARIPALRPGSDIQSVFQHDKRTLKAVGAKKWQKRQHPRCQLFIAVAGQTQQRPFPGKLRFIVIVPSGTASARAPVKLTFQLCCRKRRLL